MNIPSAFKKLFFVVGAVAILALGWCAFVYTMPVVVLHYSAEAAAPVVYFFNEDNYIIKEYINPGEVIEFRTSRHPDADYFIDVSLPFASRDGVEITTPFSRIDIYIGADTKITRTVTRMDFPARLGFD
jgi:hypothetical protein